MKLSKKAEYALRALIDLALAAEVGRALVQVSELAEKEQLPIKFLEQIMQLLKEEGFIESQRGKFGGYRLARAASTLTVGNIVRAIDGPLALIDYTGREAGEAWPCSEEEHCGLRMVMLDVGNAISGILDRYSLADVVEMTLRKMRRDQVIPPFSEAVQPGRAARRGPYRFNTRSSSVPSSAQLPSLVSDYTI